MRKYLTLLFLTFIGFSLAQRGANDEWKRNKHEIFLAGGPTLFLGDLGGLDKIGTTKSIVDLDFPMIRVGGGFGYRYRFHKRFATTTTLYYALLRGDDAQTNEIVRRSRNLSFRTHLGELTQRIELIIWAKEEQGARYHAVSGAYKSRADVFYGFVGLTGFLYVPQTKIYGKWTNLRPLKTEGQGMPGGADEYGLFNWGIPFGLGFKYSVGELWRIGLEVSYTKTFTDYLDDVSTDYYDPSVLEAQIGPEAAYASNPALENHSWFGPGMQRGNPEDKDAYLFVNFTVTRNISKSARRSRDTWWKGRSKF